MSERLTITRLIALLLFVAAVCLPACNRHDVGSEANNPAPSSEMTLAQAETFAVNAWIGQLPHTRFDHRMGTVTPTSSMTPYLDSHSVLLMELVAGPVRLHDILVVNEGPGKENVCHRVQDLRPGYVFIDGDNNLWPDGWMPLSAVKWRVAGILYTRG